MNILIAGGSGFLGQALVRHWANDDYHIDLLGRNEPILNWDYFKNNSQSILPNYDLVINLCGANIGNHRWTTKQKINLFQSRIEPTTTLANACAALGEQAPRLFNAGGVGVYGIRHDQLNELTHAVDEYTPLPAQADSFLQKISFAWEYAMQPAIDAQVKVTQLRFAVVLDKQAGALAKMSQPYRYYLGGPIGNGRQAFAWISLHDFCRTFDFLLAHPELQGNINLVAPKCISQNELAHALAKALNKPCFFRTPAWLLKCIFGEMADELLLHGQHVIPTRLLNAGFEFQDPDIDSALKRMY